MNGNRLLSTALAIILLSGCGSSSSSASTADSKPVTTQETTTSVAFKTVATDASKLSDTLTKQDYEGLFTITMPSSWQLSVGGDEIYTWIRVYDPEEPSLQVFTTLRTGYFLKNQQAKQFYENYYAISGNNPVYGPMKDFIVLEPATLENFYAQFMDYCGYLATWETTFSSFEYPQISNFEVIESFPVNNELSSIALENVMLHGSFTDTLTQAKGEGMFSGTVVDLISMTDPGYDCGYDTIYSLSAITSPYGQLSEYSDVLNTILSSVEYSDTFVQRVANAQSITMENAKQISAMTQATSQIIMDGYNSRQKSYDIKSQEYSDATLGYDRYLDTETNQVYKAEYGTMDGYDGSRYQKLDSGSDYYTEPVAGYIVK